MGELLGRELRKRTGTGEGKELRACYEEKMMVLRASRGERGMESKVKGNATRDQC